MVDRIAIACIRLAAHDRGCLTRLPDTYSVAAGTTVASALQHCMGLPSEAIDALFAERAVAVFGVTARADDVLCAGDRIEVLDRLQFDPMESRRRRALHKARQPKSRRREKP